MSYPHLYGRVMSAPAGMIRRADDTIQPAPDDGVAVIERHTADLNLRHVIGRTVARDRLTHDISEEERACLRRMFDLADSDAAWYAVNLAVVFEEKRARAYDEMCSRLAKEESRRAAEDEVAHRTAETMQFPAIL